MGCGGRGSAGEVEACIDARASGCGESTGMRQKSKGVAAQARGGPVAQGAARLAKSRRWERSVFFMRHILFLAQ
jgi:hypothetical protein